MLCLCSGFLELLENFFLCSADVTLVYLEKKKMFNLQKLLNFSSSSFVMRVNLLHPWPSLFLYGLILSLLCFSILVNYHVQVSSSRSSFVRKITLNHKVCFERSEVKHQQLRVRFKIQSKGMFPTQKYIPLTNRVRGPYWKLRAELHLQYGPRKRGL